MLSAFDSVSVLPPGCASHMLYRGQVSLFHNKKQIPAEDYTHADHILGLGR